MPITKTHFNGWFQGSLSPGSPHEHIAGEFATLLECCADRRKAIPSELDGEAAEAQEKEEEDLRERELGKDIEAMMGVLEDPDPQ